MLIPEGRVLTTLRSATTQCRSLAAELARLRLWVRWELGDSVLTRTRLRRKPRRIFYHQGPLHARRDVSLAAELADETPLPVEKLSRAEGAKLLDAGRATMAMRYRELHGFTFGDPSAVRRAEAGRGLEIFLWGVPRGRRLPTLAYHAALLFKNGVQWIVPAPSGHGDWRPASLPKGTPAPVTNVFELAGNFNTVLNSRVKPPP